MQLSQRFSVLSWFFKATMASLLLATLAGCLAALPSKKAVDDGSQPAWVNNPGDGATGSAGVHVRGRVAQEALAISRAREELAKRLGVTISSQSVTEQRVNNNRLSSTSQNQMQESVSSVEVKATVKAKWLDPDTQMMWVWVVPNP
jgi:hypothetical protein